MLCCLSDWAPPKATSICIQVVLGVQPLFPSLLRVVPQCHTHLEHIERVKPVSLIFQGRAGDYEEREHPSHLSMPISVTTIRTPTLQLLTSYPKEVLGHRASGHAQIAHHLSSTALTDDDDGGEGCTTPGYLTAWGGERIVISGP